MGSGACFISFWAWNQQVALLNEHAGDSLAGIGYLKTSGASIANSQCSVSLDGAQSSMQVISPTTIQVTLTITFLAGMPGPQQTWMQCGDNTYRGIAITDRRFVFLCGDILATI